jgi:hypothetical protein
MIIHTSTHVDIFLTIERNNMKLCKDCKHILVTDGDFQYAKCGYNRPISPVTGEPVPVISLRYCSTQRLGPHKVTHDCGEDGAYFEENTHE